MILKIIFPIIQLVCMLILLIYWTKTYGWLTLISQFLYLTTIVNLLTCLTIICSFKHLEAICLILTVFMVVVYNFGFIMSHKPFNGWDHFLSWWSRHFFLPIVNIGILISLRPEFNNWSYSVLILIVYWLVIMFIGTLTLSLDLKPLFKSYHFPYPYLFFQI